MKVGEHGPDYAKLEAGINKNIGLTALRTDVAMTILKSRILKGSHAGRSNGDDAASVISCALNVRRSFTEISYHSRCSLLASTTSSRIG